MRTKRIGIFGGTFHPVHNGHLLLAAHAREQLGLDSVLFVIDRVPPHKELGGGATTEERVRLLQLALDGIEGFRLETMELAREGKSYTFDTLTELRERFPNDELYFLMGSDMLRNFATWYRPDEISKLATLVCTERAGQNGAEAETATALREQFGTKVILLDSVSDLSSTGIRKCITNGLSLDGMVPPAVAHEIYYRGLYQPQEIRELYDKVRGALTDRRMHHTAGVIETALRLAGQNGIDPIPVEIAALLHDCAKYLPSEELFARSNDVVPILPVLHAEVGAQLANEQYDVNDPAVLQAIRLHTTGEAGMTKLDKVIYLADMIEPSRDYPAVSEIRAIQELDRAVLLALRRSVQYIEQRGFTVHPATIRAIKHLEGGQV